jgi:hypothetical protein
MSMSSGYTWDGVDLWDEWGVKVLEVTGELDLPTRKEPTEYDFGYRSNGAVAFTDDDSIFVKPRDISVKARIEATTEEYFQIKLAAFISEITSPGLHSFVVKHRNDTYRVYHRDGGVFKLLAPWNGAENHGMITFKLHEPDPAMAMLTRGLVGHWSLEEADEEEETASYTSDFSSGEDGWVAAEGAVTGNIDGIGGQNDNLRFTVNAASGVHSAYKSSILTVGKKYKVTFSYYIPSGQSNIDQLQLHSSRWGGVTSNLSTTDAWTEVEKTFTANNATPIIQASDGGSTTFQDAGGDDVFYIRGMTVQEITQADLSGNDNNASMYNFPADPYTTDREGASNKALTFDGSDDYLDTGDPFQSTFRDSFSISMWVKPDDGQPASAQIVIGQQSSDAHDRIFLYLYTNGKLDFHYESDDDTAIADTASAVFSNGAETWHHVVITSNNDTQQIDIYFDGVKQTLDSTNDGDMSDVTMADYAQIRNLFIGARNTAGSASVHFDGDLHDVRLYNRALSAGEVRLLYHLYNDALDY